MERCSFHGTWWVRQTSERLVAFDLSTKEEVELRGAMLTALPRSNTLDGGSPVARLATALRAEGRPGTIRELLAPDGFGLLFLELTGRCNESCVHCYASSGPEVGDALELELVRAILEDAHELGFRSVQLTGGDPLISPHLLAAVELVRGLGMRAEVYTNGLALRRPLAESLGKLGVKMAFSFYSRHPATHDAVTQTPGSQARTLDAIALALALGIEIRVGLIATHERNAEVAATRSFLIDQGVPEAVIAVSRERSVGRGTFRDASDVQEHGRAHADAPFSELRSFGKLAVTYQGKVVPCIFDRQMVLGDVRERRLRDVVQGEVPSVRLGPRRLASANEELSCDDCRFRRRLLAG